MIMRKLMIMARLIIRRPQYPKADTTSKFYAQKRIFNKKCLCPVVTKLIMNEQSTTIAYSGIALCPTRKSIPMASGEETRSI